MRAATRCFIWSNKKIFTVEALTNKQMVELMPVALETYRSTSKDVSEARNHVWISVWAHVASDGSKSYLVFLDEGEEGNR